MGLSCRLRTTEAIVPMDEIAKTGAGKKCMPMGDFRMIKMEYNDP
jgi:hypothetical protein